jgi:hypothetical protein
MLYNQDHILIDQNIGKTNIQMLLLEYPVVPQHVLSPADQSVHVPNFSFYAVWYRASNSWGADAIFTGWSTDLPDYILMD